VIPARKDQQVNVVMQPGYFHFDPTAVAEPDRYIYFLAYCGWQCEEFPTTSIAGDRWNVAAERDGQTVVARWPTRPQAWRAAARLSVTVPRLPAG